MTRHILGFVTCALSLVTCAIPVSAHHSLAAEYEVDRMVTITGVISEMKWTNPHSWLTVDVRDDKGQVSRWAVEFGSPNSLYRRGWRRDDLPTGLMVTVTAYPNRDKSRTVNAIDVKLPDGRTLFAGTGPNEGGR